DIERKLDGSEWAQDIMSDAAGELTERLVLFGQLALSDISSSSFRLSRPRCATHLAQREHRRDQREQKARRIEERRQYGGSSVNALDLQSQPLALGGIERDDALESGVDQVDLMVQMRQRLFVWCRKDCFDGAVEGTPILFDVCVQLALRWKEWKRDVRVQRLLEVLPDRAD